MHLWVRMKTYLVLFFSITYLAFSTSVQAKDIGHGYVFDLSTLFSYTGASDIQLAGLLQGDLTVFSDQYPSPDDSSSEDFVSGLSFEAGKYFGDWLLKAHYEYRYRFDVNGHIGEMPRVAHLRTNVNTQRFMLGAEYNILAFERWQWSVSVASGWSIHTIDLRTFNNTEDITLSHRDNSFTWQVRTSIEYELSNNWHWRLSLQHADLGNLETASQLNGVALSIDDYIGWDILLGMRYFY